MTVTYVKGINAQVGAFLRCMDDAAFGGLLAWVFGSGFPKSHDVAKALDKSEIGLHRGRAGRAGRAGQSFGQEYERTDKGEPVSDAARQWEGWGTALKPAFEPIILARKPLVGAVAANVLQHGTGALNIDACRVATNEPLGGGMVSKGRPKVSEGWDRPWMHDAAVTERKKAESADKVAHAEALGRWPANVIHDGSEEVIGSFPRNAGQQGPIRGTEPSVPAKGDVVYGFRDRVPFAGHLDSGSAARFFYSAKADAQDRLGSKHPTVKPVDLMRWLARLITPPGGTVLDPFAGSGTTGMACLAEGFNAVLIEREAEYVADIRRRLAHVSGGDAPLFATVDAAPPPEAGTENLRRVRGRKIGPVGLRR